MGTYTTCSLAPACQFTTSLFLGKSLGNLAGFRCTSPSKIDRFTLNPISGVRLARIRTATRPSLSRTLNVVGSNLMSSSSLSVIESLTEVSPGVSFVVSMSWSSKVNVSVVFS